MKKLKPTKPKRKYPSGFGVLAYTKPDAKGVLRDADGHPVMIRTGAMVDGPEDNWGEDTEYEVIG